MLSFKRPELTDKEWVDSCLLHANSMNCEYTFGNVFCWVDSYSIEICHYKNFFICRWGNPPEIAYSVPLGEGNFSEAVEEIINDAKSLGAIPRIYGVTEGYLLMLQEAFFGKFNYNYDSGINDYIYSVSKMESLNGKKYHGKRNHISNFKKNYPDWQYENISKDNIADCINMHEEWLKENESEDDEDFVEEFEAVKKAFNYFDELGFKGGLIRVGSRVVAYCIGEAQMNGRCFVTHFEKAFASVNGAYPIINQEFTKNCLSSFEYVNREEDLGLEGLRKAKQSYHPEILLEKCVAVYND
ncbi:MAG: DUF2156 domain-containing protein [Eubacterium sp.]|nr:DUF2156 domain-containing protein [Eubacterium sp.]